MFKLPHVIAFFALGLAAQLPAQSTWYVPDDFGTIQDAINGSVSGDTIFVRPGTFIENLDFFGKQLNLESTDGPEVTIITSAGADSIVFLDATPLGTRVQGFTLTGGVGRILGGNDHYGGGVCARNGAIATIKDCLVLNNGNSSTTFAGGIYSGDPGTALTVKHCVIAGNYAWASGGATLTDWYATMDMDRCTIAGNSSSVSFGNQGGIAGANHGDTWIDDCILWGNSGGQIEPFSGWGGAYSSGVDFFVSYSDVDGGFTGVGNINADPMFVNAVGDDYHLLAGSPCIDAGNPASPQDPDGSPADMGAFPLPNPYGDNDADDDGLLDDDEVAIHGTDPQLFDTDGDGLGDGQELGVTYTTAPPDTNPAIFVEDSDPLSTTDPLLYDSDAGGASDGNEDVNKNGAIDANEGDPNASQDDLFQMSVQGLSPNQQATISVWDCHPGFVVVPFYSLAGQASNVFAAYHQLELQLTLPVTQLTGMQTSAGGNAFSVVWVPPFAPIGRTVYWQAVEVAPGGFAHRPSIPLTTVIQ